MSNPEVLEKPCKFCRTLLPNSRKHFVKSGKTGVSNTCKACHSAISNKRLCIINPFAPKDGLRGCKTCLRRFPDNEDYFYLDSRNPNWTSFECRSCSTQRHSTYNKANSETLRANRQQWVQENRIWVLDYFRNYRVVNRARIQTWQRDWRERNPERERLHWLNREARKRALPNTFTKDDYDALIGYWGGACAISGEVENIHLDHWIPLADPQCPGTTAENLVPLVAYLNFSKNDTAPLEWLSVNFGDDASLINDRIQAYFDWVRQRKYGK